MEKIDQAIPNNILDMRFNQNPHEFVDDEHFLWATYRVGLYVEKLKALKAAKESASNPGSGSGLGQGRKDGQSGKGSGNTRMGKEEKGPKRFEKTSSDNKTEKSGTRGWGTSRWDGPAAALKGVPQIEIDEHKKNKDSYWRCGNEGHRTWDCYARHTAKGTELHEAPKASAITATSMLGKRRQNAKLSHGSTVVPRLCELLPTIYRKLLKGS